MNGVINLKKRRMIFEKKSLRIVVPLDPSKGAHYTEPVCGDDSDDVLDCIYQIAVQDQSQVNPTTDGSISWECNSFCNLDLDEEIKCWQNQLHKVTTLNCNMMMRLFHRVTTEARELPTHDDVTMEFLGNFESIVPE